MARPVVASTAAAEGIDAKDGLHFRVAASAKQEAEIVSALLSDNDARAKLGAAARAHVMEHYGWSGQLAALDRIMTP